MPVTFTYRFVQVPESSPGQFPGVNGQVAVLRVVSTLVTGYYDASNETPMFRSAYGLSYTHFFVQPSAISSQLVQNTASQSGEDDQAGAGNGQSSRQVTVSATVGDQRPAQGSRRPDVAQLDLVIPAAARSRRAAEGLPEVT